MAVEVQSSHDAAIASTRPRLQALSQSFSSIDEQIQQAAQILGLPKNWSIFESHEERCDALSRVVRARAEWVLRWILDKLKNGSDVGAQARASPLSWGLLEWMIRVLPVSRCAPHLRDAGFPTILERTLFENFDTDGHISEDVTKQDISESSETIQEDPQPSRKRKRGDIIASPPKRSSAGLSDSKQLFLTVHKLMRSIMNFISNQDENVESTAVEVMKMVFRTESAQASRILRFWFTAVRKLIVKPQEPQITDKILDVGPVIEIWELRMLSSSDVTASSFEEFSNECLIPVLALYDQLRDGNTLTQEHAKTTAIVATVHLLEKLLTRHLLAPSRAAFFESTATTKPGLAEARAALFNTGLSPLRAKLLQAAQIEDENEQPPRELTALYRSVAFLLDLSIRTSPPRAAKNKITETRWFQAAFLALIECAGCELKASPDSTTRTAAAVLEDVLHVLHTRNVNVDSKMVADVFRYHSGLGDKTHQATTTHWPLIGALIKLDPTLFVLEPGSAASSSGENHSFVKGENLATIVFDGITSTKPSRHETNERQLSNVVQIQIMNKGRDRDTSPSSNFIIHKIILPIMVAFARNRNLLGFLRRWADQLEKNFVIKSRKVRKPTKSSIWESQAISMALVDLFEQSLTPGQITEFVNEHCTRIERFSERKCIVAKEGKHIHELDSYRKAAASACITPAILQSLNSDDNIMGVKAQLLSLLCSYSSWIRDDWFSAYIPLSSSWLTLCQLVEKLWPVELHGSSHEQQDILKPLLRKAIEDMSSSDGGQGRQVISLARASAMMFYLKVCTHLQELPTSAINSEDQFKKSLTSFFAHQLEPAEYIKMLELFCTTHVTLVGQIDKDTAKEVLCTLIAKVSQLDETSRSKVNHGMSRAIFGEAEQFLQRTYAEALLDTLESKNKHDIHPLALDALQNINPFVLPRERREAIINRLTTLLTLETQLAANILAVLVRLMQVPNATSLLSTNSNVVFKIADSLHAHKQQSAVDLQLLQEVVKLTLSHILPNQEQAQNKAFLKDLRSQLKSVVRSKGQCSATTLAILRATIQVQGQNKLLDLERYIALLKKVVSYEDDKSASLSLGLESLMELPISSLQEHNLYVPTQAWLRDWVVENADFDAYLVSTEKTVPEVVHYVSQLHNLIMIFGIFPNVEWLLDFSLKVINESLPEQAMIKKTKLLSHVLRGLTQSQKLDLAFKLTTVAHSDTQPSSYRILETIISSLDDKTQEDPLAKQKQLAILPTLCTLLASTPNPSAFKHLLSSITTVLNNKSTLTSQHGIESILSALATLTSRNSPPLPASHAPEIYTQICEIVRLVLLTHRSRLGGRMHLLILLLQNLLTCLFKPNNGRFAALPPWLRPSPSPSSPSPSSTDSAPAHPLTPQNASHYTRLLTTLCHPPLSTLSKSHQRPTKTSHKQPQHQLTDPIKLSRDTTATFLYPWLTTYCRLQLSGQLDPGVREKLVPGVWEVVGLAALGGEEGVGRGRVEAMFAGLGRADRDVWRGIWEEWEAVEGKRGSGERV